MHDLLPGPRIGRIVGRETLQRLGYDADPEKLQLIIRMLFERISQRGFHVTAPGSGGEVPVLPFALFEVLDGKDTNDYVQRVEPSVQGGRKMAAALLDFIATAME